MECKKCNKKMTNIKNSNGISIDFCETCIIFFVQEEGVETSDSSWKTFEESMFRVTYWIGNNKFCSCHRKQEIGFQDFYSFEEAENFAVHFLADGEVMEGVIRRPADKDRGVVSIKCVGEEELYDAGKIEAMARLEVERRMSDGGQYEEDVLEEANDDYYHHGEGNYTEEDQ